MASPLRIQMNGQQHIIEDLSSPAALANVVQSLGLKGDRIAVELNGQIIPRTSWSEVQIVDGDRLEIVHFVGGGASAFPSKAL
ncbi:MAG: sulfur carrier protein ThiS [Acidobacteriaceae bacterium]